MLSPMSYIDEPTQVLVERNCWFYPNAFSLLLGGQSYELPSFRREGGELLYEAAYDDKINAWNMKTRFCEPGGAKVGYFRPMSKQQPLFTNLSTVQKDQILHAVQSDHVRTIMYHVPEMCDPMMEFLKNSAYPQRYMHGKSEQSFVVPKVMTTRAALFPLHKIPKERRTRSAAEEFSKSYFEKDVNDMTPSFISPAVWSKIKPTISNEFYPTQFMAIHHVGAQLSDRNVVIDDSLIKQFQSNKHALEQKDFMLDRDVWTMWALQPYNLKQICTVFDLRSAKLMLKNFEEEFIDDFYGMDDRLEDVDARLSTIKGSDPTHFSKFSDEGIATYERIRKMAPLSLG